MSSRVSPVLQSASPLTVVGGEGVYVETAEGEHYLDFTSGFGVTNTGHCHPDVVRAVQQQAENMLHAQLNCYRHPIVERLAARLFDVTPGPIESFFFANSGAEAVEAAVKLAKQATGRQSIVAFQRGFHGRTHLAMALTTSKVVTRAGYGPLPSGVHIAPIPYQHGGREDLEALVPGALRRLEELFATTAAPSETAAMIIEPVLGEGGYIPLPGQFLRELRAFCSTHDILLVVDEVQSGFGRTGAMFAIEHAGVEPDILVMAKGLGSGFPISAIGASTQLMEAWPVGSHGGTYGGNPMACAAALATIDILTHPGFLEQVRARGNQLRTGLEQLAEEAEAVVDVRGLGLMLGLEFDHASTAKEVIRHCREEGHLLLLGAGYEGTTVRLAPPLVVTEPQMTAALEALRRAVRAT